MEPVPHVPIVVGPMHCLFEGSYIPTCKMRLFFMHARAILARFASSCLQSLRCYQKLQVHSLNPCVTSHKYFFMITVITFIPVWTVKVYRVSGIVLRATLHYSRYWQTCECNFTWTAHEVHIYDCCRM